LSAPRFPRPSAVEWACLAAGLLLVVQYGWLYDDAFVYFRYADNALFLGKGLVYNGGEYVEGYSSPLWMLVLLAVRSTGADWWLLTRLLGVASFAAFWALLVALNRRLSPPGAPAVNLPLVGTSLHYAVASYFTGGLETPAVQVCAALFACFAARPSSRTLQCLLGVTPLVRHELAAPLLLAWLWVVARERRVPRRMTLAAVLATGAWLAFRVVYYADLLPNTFYLKDGTDFAQGWTYLGDTLWTYGLPWVLALGLACCLARPRGSHAGARLAMLGFAAVVALYVVRIGGAPLHYRYLAFPTCLALAATAGLAEHVLAGLGPERARLVRPAGVALALLFGAYTLTRHPDQLARHPLWGSESSRAVDKVYDAAFHRAKFGLPPWGAAERLEQRPRYRAFLEADPEGRYRDVVAAKWCRNLYDRFDVRALHSLGLTDPVLARTKMPADRPAHKRGLKPLADRMRAAMVDPAFRFAPGGWREAVARGDAPAFVARNLETVELLERKMYNRHDWAENLSLALSFPERIDPD